MPVVVVERLDRATIRLDRAVDRETVQGVCDGLARADGLLQMQRRDVIVVVVGAAAMTAELVEFAGEECVVAPVVQGVEDGNAVDRQGDGTSEQTRFRRDRFVGHLRGSRELPRVGVVVRLRHRKLLLPAGDSHHHLVGGHAVAFNHPHITAGEGLDRFGERVEAGERFGIVGAGWARRPVLGAARRGGAGCGGAGGGGVGRCSGGRCGVVRPACRQQRRAEPHHPPPHHGPAIQADGQGRIGHVGVHVLVVVGWVVLGRCERTSLPSGSRHRFLNHRRLLMSSSQASTRGRRVRRQAD